MRQEMEDRALDRLLDSFDAPPPGPGLATRIVASAPAPRPIWWPFAALWQPLGGLAAAIALGIVVGAAMPAPVSAEPEDTPIWAAPDASEPLL